MKFLSFLPTLLLGFTIIDEAASQVQRKQCVLANGCRLRVDVECSYRDANNVLRSCIGPRIQGSKPPDNEPFLEVTASECARSPRLQATIKYRMCNDSDVGFIPNVSDNYIKYRGSSIESDDWDSRIRANTCREKTIVRKINPCEDPFTAGIVISMDGRMTVDGDNYCRCFNKHISKATKSDSIADDDNDDLTDDDLSDDALIDDDANDSVDNCNLEDVVITELASPEPSFAKYIELYFHGCEGRKIDQDLKIITFRPGDIEASNLFVHLQGNMIRDDGFFTICNSEQAETFYGRGECTYIGGLTSAANLRGTETIAVVKGNLEEYNIIDMFGVPGQEAVESDQYFKNGRAVRKSKVWEPSEYFNADDWYVFPGKCKQEVSPEAMDINIWEDVQGPVCPGDVDIIITEIVDVDVESETSVPRYVELHSPRRRLRGEGFDHGLKLVVFHSESEEPHWASAVPIEYMPENGFLLVCNQAAYDIYTEKCAEVSSNIAGPANSNGNDQIALISGDEENGWFVVDIYGVIGEDGYDTDHEFFNARVIRKKSVTETRATWSKHDWQLCPSDTPDPNEWETDECGLAKGAPTPSPSSVPTPTEQKDCEFFFTELADCEEKPYIEIKSTCPGAKISRDISVVSWKQYGFTCDVDLKGVTVPDDGFIVICSNRIQHQVEYGGQYKEEDGVWRDLSVCDIEDFTLLTYFGHSSFALLDENSECEQTDCLSRDCYAGCSDKYLDIYGYRDASRLGTPYYFDKCRAVRVLEYPYGLSWFEPATWEVICPAVRVPATPDEKCDPREWNKVHLVLYFTEFCDPKDDSSKSFIELYSPNKRDVKIEDDLIIMKWEGTSNVPSYTFQSIKGQTVNENGFLVLCTNWYAMSEDTCNLQTGYHGIANINGQDHYALAKCEFPGPDCDMIDVYGSPGTDPKQSGQDFSGGRSIRLEYFYPMARKIFDIDQWIISENEVSADMCDPGKIDPNPGEEFRRDPKAPSSGKNSKNGNGKNKRGLRGQ